MQTDINLIVGIVGAVLATLVIAPRIIPTYQAAARRLGATTRRISGQENFENLVREELTGYRRDVERGFDNVLRETKSTRHRQDDRSAALSAHGARVNRVRNEVEELGILLRQYTEALGPMWQTAQGHRMPMRLLSTSHLNNIIEGGFGGYEARQFASRELERRTIDTQWREAEARGETAPTLDQMAAGQRRATPTMLTINGEAQQRIDRVTPSWARKIIMELRVGTLDNVPAGQRQRVKRLPQWTQRVIEQLVRSRQG